MRILHVLDHSLPLHSGYAFRTANILREQRALGYDTMALTTPRQNAGETAFEDVGDIRFYRTPMRSTSKGRTPVVRYAREMAATAKRIDALVREYRPDVLHAHSPVLNALPALWVARRRGLPLVYEVRALWEDAAVDHGTTGEGSLRYRASRWLETWAMRRATHVTTICEGLRGEILARRIPSSNVTVIPNAVNTRDFRFDSPSDTELRAKLRLDGCEVVGFAGSFYGYEGLDLLLEAVSMLAVRRPNLRALLVGGGPQEDALRRLATARGIAERVVFSGRVSHAEVERYYGLIDVLAYPRRRMRLTDLVTPLKPLEAMAQGRMFVASNVGGHRELVQHGVTGFLCKSDDATALAEGIERVLEDRSSWPRIAARARQFVESERTWSRSVRRYQDVYSAVVSGAQAVPSPRALL